MTRIAFKMKLKKGHEAEYERRHQEIWPELSVLLKDAGIGDYSIFLDEETSILFAIQKRTTSHHSATLSQHPLMQRWWNYMADIMETNADHSPVVVPLREVFYLK